MRSIRLGSICETIFDIHFDEDTGKGEGCYKGRNFKILGFQDELPIGLYCFTAACFQGGPKKMGGLRIYDDIAVWSRDPASFPF